MRRSIFVIMIALTVLPTFSFATGDYQLTIVNHFDKSLQYKITINPQVLSDLPSNFSLASAADIHTKVEDFQKEAYLRVDDGSGNSAFWGVNIENNKVIIHGYIAKGIAYSWKQNSITFCTPDEYKKHKSCTY